jgi:hypothetical protein
MRLYYQVRGALEIAAEYSSVSSCKRFIAGRFSGDA